MPRSSALLLLCMVLACCASHHRALASSIDGHAINRSAIDTSIGGTRDRTPLTGTIYGALYDSSNGMEISKAVIRTEDHRHATESDDAGRFVLTGLPEGSYGVVVEHVGYESIRRVIHVTAEPGERVVLRLRPRIHRVDEFTVTGERFAPLTSGDRARYTIPRSVLRDMSIDGAADIARQLPGAVFLGDRFFFRGVGFEHVLPLLDGMPAREPLRGEWITPPPDAILSVDLLPGSFDAEHGQALGGIFHVTLPPPGREHEGRVSVKGDRLDLGSRYHGTDHVQATVTGPLGPLAYTASGQLLLSDGYVRYDHGLPEHDLFGISLGDRMSGSEVGLVRLALGDPDRPLYTTVTWLGRSVRSKEYLHHYSRAEWVGVNPREGLYTGYLADGCFSSDSLAYDGPLHVPVRTRSSQLLQGNVAARPWKDGQARLAVRLAEHDYVCRVGDLDFDTELEGRQWLHAGATRTTHQSEMFFSTHGDYPEYEEGRSREGSAAGSLRYRAGNHDWTAGAGLTAGRHRMFGIRPGSITWFGSLRKELETLDTFGYLQDTWWSDRHSSVTLAGRWDHQRICGFGGEGVGWTLSPRIGFRQPISARDAFHAQAGILHQFPTLIGHFMRQSGPIPQGIELQAQRVRALDIGVQHQHDERFAAYLGAWFRQYTEVTFSVRRAADSDLLDPDAVDAPVHSVPYKEIEAQGFEVILDHQFHRAFSGQLRGEIGSQDMNGGDIPWSRTLAIAGWLRARPMRPLSLSAAFRWDSGQPYKICLGERGCTADQRFQGRLPDAVDLDLGGRWSFARGLSGLHLVSEARNVFDRRIPTFAFGVHSAKVGVENFNAYYDRFGKTGGYIVGSAQAARGVDVAHPQTLTAGRNLRVGVEYEF